jgi:hypothetical protein
VLEDREGPSEYVELGVARSRRSERSELLAKPARLRREAPSIVLESDGRRTLRVFHGTNLREGMARATPEALSLRPSVLRDEVRTPHLHARAVLGYTPLA